MFAKKLCIALLLCLAIHGGGLLSGRAMAQGKPADKDKKTVDDTESQARDRSKSLLLKKVDWRSTVAKVKAPEYTFRNVLTQNAAKAIPEWHMITVSYETLPEWLDQVVVNYYVLLMNDKKGTGGDSGKTARPAAKKEPKEPKDSEATKVAPYTLLEGTVSYVDVPSKNNAGQGGHISTIFIRPNTIERYGEPVAIGVEIIAGDEVVAKNEFAQNSKLATATRQHGKWWTLISKDDKVAVRSDCLLNRTETPFVLVNYLDEETIQRH